MLVIVLPARGGDEVDAVDAGDGEREQLAAPSRPDLRR
jgi:hypothetical protein